MLSVITLVGCHSHLNRNLLLLPILGLILFGLDEQNLGLAQDSQVELEPCPQPGYPGAGGDTPRAAHCVNTTRDTQRPREQLDEWKFLDWSSMATRFGRKPADSWFNRKRTQDRDENSRLRGMKSLRPTYDSSLLSAFDMPEGCGSAPLNRLDTSGYVINGDDQIYGEFPSFVRLEITWNPYMEGYCGATLISNRYVLTAAHCLFHEDRRARASQMRVILGEHRIRIRDPYEIESKISRVCVAPNYKVTDYGSTYDWALLELVEPVSFNRHVQPACLPREPIVTSGRSAKCYLVGLGAIGFNPKPIWNGNLSPIEAKVVQKLDMEQVPCRAWDIPESDKSRACYTRANSRPGDSCQGDSGGPILCTDKRGRWTVTASVSYGTRYCDDVGPAAWIGVYANIQKLVGEMERHCG